MLIHPEITFKIQYWKEPGVVVHTCQCLRGWDRFVSSSRPIWDVHWVQGQAEQHGETPISNQKRKIIIIFKNQYWKILFDLLIKVINLRLALLICRYVSKIELLLECELNKWKFVSLIDNPSLLFYLDLASQTSFLK